MSIFNTLPRTVAALAAMLWSLSAEAADEPKVLAPANEWSVSRDEESCQVVRHFGTDRDALTFALQAFSPEATSYNVVMRGSPLPHRDPGSLEFTIRLGPDSVALPTTGVLGGGRVPRLTFSTSLEDARVIEARRDGEALPLMIDPAREAAVDEVEIAFSRGRPLLLQLGPMSVPMQQLRECTKTLPEAWGLDPAVQRTLSRRPVPIDLASWLGPGSYPWEYLRNSLSIRVFIRLMTDEQGHVSQCMVQSPRGENVAGIIACRELVRTARFEPALDAQGNAVRSYYTTAIFYITPRHNGPRSGASRTQGI